MKASISHTYTVASSRSPCSLETRLSATLSPGSPCFSKLDSKPSNSPNLTHSPNLITVPPCLEPYVLYNTLGPSLLDLVFAKATGPLCRGSSPQRGPPAPSCLLPSSVPRVSPQPTFPWAPTHATTTGNICCLQILNIPSSI